MKKVIIDTDIGEDIDDIWSVVYMLASPEIDVRLICVSCGYTDYQVKIVAKILQTLGKTDIPIAKGLPLRLGSFPSRRFVQDFDLEKYPGKIYDSAIEAFEAVSEKGVTIIELAPMSNLSYVLKNSPRVSEECEVVGMAGAVYQGYLNQEEVRSEYNVAIDIGAAINVFASKIKKTLMPLDVCRSFILEGEYYRALQKSGSVYAKLVLENYAIWQSDYAGGAIQFDEKTSTSILYDMLPPLYLAMPEQLQCVPLKLGIDKTGRTVEEAEGYDVECAVKVLDMDALFRKTIETLTR